jgi:hypothetical protein
MKKLLLAFTVAGLALASAKTYTVTLFQPSTVGQTELKPGDYKLELREQKAVLKSGKTISEAPVTVENEKSKFGATTVRYRNGDGKYHIQEIRLGGTNMKIVFNE